MTEHGQTVCLCMIVKNEEPVILRCLSSARAIADHWIIVDTGSQDRTREMITGYMNDIPGQLMERPWVNFAHNRNEALEHARKHADYLFVMDADEIVEIAEGWNMPRLTADAYHVEISYGPYRTFRTQLVKSSLPFRYSGVLHEYLDCEGPHSIERLCGLRIVPFHDGARARDPKTYARDALVLERALLDEPSNSRYVFYLAQSYRDAGDDELAIRHYRRRSEMGGWDEEIWYSLYQIAQLKERSARSWAEVREDYLAAFAFRPNRAGPLYRIGRHYQARKQYVLAHLFFARAMQIPFPAEDRLFVERDLYDYLLPMQYAETCHEIGDFASAAEIANQLLESGRLPPELAPEVVRSLAATAVTANGREE